jgi:hypothetical protein
VIDLAEAPAAFIRAACVPVDGSSHASGTLDEAQAILAAHPEVSTSSIHVAAILADDPGVRQFLALDPGAATAPGGPYGWDPLTHLCFSRYLRLAPTRSEGFLRAATALLDAGASANKASAVLQSHPGASPTWTLKAPGHEGVTCWFAATRPRGSDHRRESPKEKEIVGTAEHELFAPVTPNGRGGSWEGGLP